MALLCNGRMYVGAGVASFGATAHLSTFAHTLPRNFTNRIRNITAGEGITDDKVGLPMGYVQKGWMMPQKAGLVSARMYDIAITTTGSGLRGYPIDGTSSLTITTNTPAGELIVSGIGATTFEITSNTPLLTASISGTGSSTITVSTNTPLLGAIADLIASGTMTVSGGLTAYAVGFMEGTTEEAGLTNAGIANSVWNSILSNYTEAGSAGEALGLAGSGGVNYNTLAQAVWSYVTRTVTSDAAPTSAENATAVWGQTIEGINAEEIMRIIAAVLAGKVSGAGTGVETFKGLDGVTNRVISTVDAAGNRTVVTLDGT